MHYKPEDLVGKTWSCYRLTFPGPIEVEICGVSEQDVRGKTKHRYGCAQAVMLVRSWGVIGVARERNGRMEFQLKAAGRDPDSTAAVSGGSGACVKRAEGNDASMPRETMWEC